MDEKKAAQNQEPDEKDQELRIGDQELARQDKFRKLSEKGIAIFPHKATWTHDVSRIVSEYSDVPKEELEGRAISVTVPGRIMSIRKMGKATFFHLSDGQVRLQAYIRADSVGAETYDLFSLIDIGDVISVQGTLFKTRTGELTVLCKTFTFLAKCLHPLPEK